MLVTEDDARASAQDRADLKRLQANLAELLNHPEAMGVPTAVRRLVDGGVDPVVVARTCLIGDRDGGLMYKLATRAPALWAHEQAAEQVLDLATALLPDAPAATLLVAGACWLAEQFTISRPLLVGLLPAEVRPWPTKGRGALDYVDARRVATRAWLVDALHHAALPSYAPLQYEAAP